MNEKLKKTLDETKALIEAMKKDPKMADEVAQNFGKPEDLEKKQDKPKRDLELEQTIHNLRQRPPMGIKSIDDEQDEKRKRLESRLAEKTGSGVKKNEFAAMVKSDDDKYLAKALQAKWKTRPMEPEERGGLGERLGIKSKGGWKHGGGTVMTGAYSGSKPTPGVGGTSDKMRSMDLKSGQYKMHGPKGQLPKSEMSKEELKSCMKADDKWYGKMKQGVKKDDKPHPAGSPEDKAHDVVEEGQKVHQAVDKVKGPKDKFFSHLRDSKDDPNWKRSPENQKAGKDK